MQRWSQVQINEGVWPSLETQLGNDEKLTRRSAAFDDFQQKVAFSTIQYTCNIYQAQYESAHYANKEARKQMDIDDQKREQEKAENLEAKKELEVIRSICVS